MKRMIAAAAIIIAALAVSFVLGNKSAAATDNMLNVVSSAAEERVNTADYSLLARNIEDEWGKTQAVLADCMTDHTYSEVNSDIQKLISALECEDTRQARLLFSKVKLSLSELRESMEPALRRIF